MFSCSFSNRCSCDCQSGRTFSFRKIDNNNNPLPGAVFALRDSCGIDMFAATSDAAGMVCFKCLTFGCYTLYERSAPSGFTASSVTARVNINARGEVFINGRRVCNHSGLTFVNTNNLVTGQFALQKTDLQGNRLTGAVFRLTNNNDNTSVLQTSNSITDLIFENLRPGSYSLAEIQPPVGFQPNTTIVPIQVNQNGNVTANGNTVSLANPLIVRNTPSLINGNLHIMKTDAQGNRLAGAVFRLTNIANGNSVSLTSNQQANLVFSNLAPGNYTLTETQAPPGFQLPSISLPISVSNNGSVLANGVSVTPINPLLVTNVPLLINGNLVLRKTDLQGNRLPGAVFVLTNVDTGNSITLTSTLEADLVFANLPPGAYILTEIQAPPGHEPIITNFQVVVSSSGSVTINGVIVTPSNPFIITNTPIALTGDLFIRNVDTSGNLLAGAVYRLTNNSTGNSIFLTTNAISEILFSDLPPGTYTLVMVQSPPGFQLHTTVYNVVVSDSGEVTVNGILITPTLPLIVINLPLLTSNLVFQKTDINGNPLSGAVFALRANGSNVFTATSDTFGNVSFSGLVPGTYSLEEITPPPGFQITGLTFEIVVDDLGGVTVDGIPSQLFEDYNFIDFPITTSSLTILVTDPAGNTLPNAVLSLTNQTSGAIINATSDINGFASFVNIPAGSYILTETQAPPGHNSSPISYNVTVTSGGSVLVNNVVVNNSPIVVVNLPTDSSSQLSFLKQDQIGNPVSGAVFALTVNGSPVLTATSSSLGIVTFNGIAPGDYVLLETQAAPGFQLSNSTFDVIVNASGAVTINGLSAREFSAFIQNNQSSNFSSSFVINKVNESGSLGLPGAIFQLTNNTSGSTIQATSDSSGNALFDDLPTGAYTLREIQAPSGYTPITRAVQTLVLEDGSVILEGRVVTIDQPFILTNMPQNSTRTFSFVKTDQFGNTLSGAVFGLELNNNPIATATSNTNGVVTFSGINSGSFSLREISAPSGYNPSSVIVPVVVDTSGNVTVAGQPSANFNGGVFVDNPIDFNRSLSFLKLTSSGNPLSNVVFRLVSIITGATVAQATSNINGTVTFNNIPSGNYLLQETTPPNFEPMAQTLVQVNVNGSVLIGGIPSSNYAAINMPII